MDLMLHATVDADDAKAIADAFARDGWSLRKCGWSEYEVSTAGAELVIEASSPVLVHGPATPDDFRRSVALMRTSRLRFQAELYDDAKLVAHEQS